MKLITFFHAGRPRLGAVLPDRPELICDLAAADERLPTGMTELLAGGRPALEQAKAAVAAAPGHTLHARAEVRIAPPVTAPGKIVGVGLNYRDHAEEVGLELPDEPAVFAKFASALAAAGEPIRLPANSDEVDAEAELAVVIGRPARNVRPEDARLVIGGYTAANDVGARDWQFRGTQWTLSKSFDSFAPIGPSLVTADEMPDPQDLRIRLSISGETLQDSNTSQMIFGVGAIVAYLSRVMTLEPGDLILTGTPAGVGFVRKPPRFLRAGDETTVEIDGLEPLVNPVVADKEAYE